jgi:hypothetical protein
VNVGLVVGVGRRKSLCVEIPRDGIFADHRSLGARPLSHVLR